jgi:hypothetical protein
MKDCKAFEMPSLEPYRLCKGEVICDSRCYGIVSAVEQDGGILPVCTYRNITICWVNLLHKITVVTYCWRKGERASWYKLE